VAEESSGSVLDRDKHEFVESIMNGIVTKLFTLHTGRTAIVKVLER
jgi:hypothetical protein